MAERPKSRGCGQVTYHQETRDPQLACIFLLPDLGIGKQHSKFIREDPFGPTGVLLWIAIYIMDSKVVDFDISAQFEASKGSLRGLSNCNHCSIG